MARPCGKFEVFFAATTLLFFVLAVITLAEPLVLLIAVVVFGRPLFFLLLFAPSVFVILLPLLIFYTITPASKFGKFFIASVLTVLILGLPPLWLNTELKAKAAAWTSQDHNQIELPLRGASLGIKKQYNYERQSTQCDDLCLRVLLTGTAKRFLISFSDRPYLPPTGREVALEFSLERRDVCPAVRFEPGSGMLDIPDGKEGGEKASAVDIIQLRMAGGECLIERSRSLGEAEIVITRGQIKQGINWLDTGFDLDADTMQVFRTSVHSQTGAGSYEEVYRQTSIHYLEFGPLLLPFVTSGSELEMAPGIMRFNREINWPGERYAPPAITGLLTEVLGLDLGLNDDQVGERIEQTNDSELRDDRASTAAE